MQIAISSDEFTIHKDIWKSILSGLLLEDLSHLGLVGEGVNLGEPSTVALGGEGLFGASAMWTICDREHSDLVVFNGVTQFLGVK